MNFGCEKIKYSDICAGSKNVTYTCYYCRKGCGLVFDKNFENEFQAFTVKSENEFYDGDYIDLKNQAPNVCCDCYEGNTPLEVIVEREG